MNPTPTGLLEAGAETAALDGVIVVDKPMGWTSHDVVGRMRGIMRTKRVGHLGTLDPIATGVLPVMIGQATRLARFLERAEKTYEAVIRFGFATSTYDRAGEPLGDDTHPVLTAADVEACLPPLRGEIEQIPPPVSAKKVNGVPAYRLARKNIAVELAPVPVSIYELTLQEFNGIQARIRVRCSTGTYIRSIAHEIGLTLGCGAHIDSLVRTQSGAFHLDRAFTLDRLQTLRNEERLSEALLPSDVLLPDFPAVYPDDITLLHIRQGRNFPVSPFRVDAGAPYVKAIGPDGRLAAIGEIALPHVYHPAVVLV